MTRTMQLERWLFEIKCSVNGHVPLKPETVLNGLTHCLGATNVAVAYEAARLLSDERKKAVRA